ncbi:PP2C family serine/threonine-protein phosphatase [Cellulomonas sp. PhB143]|uniref:PP2C family protein-serine/threonine phosphatase n=1 Tax=Cellulomonas sp. PhB143 TaxID=2485186 RepID=UPI000F4A81C2|nr:protein phosphatase 2C domain-containing protein [Cellulomonas sp. PhB143]ROS76728.1 protein phosphatase [Cellulomonas sp. PhB143]
MSTATGTSTYLVWGAATHRGLRRTLNEDSFLADRSAFFVADGMGGHDAGEVASATAVESLRALARGAAVDVDVVRARLDEAQARVRAIESAPGRGAGTTLSGVVVVEHDDVPYWLVVNVGDSRTYQLSGGTLQQLSVDHSEVQELVEAGLITAAAAAAHPRRHVVTRALGSWPPPEPDCWYVPVVMNDRILVCSDGLTGEVDDARIVELLLEHPAPQAAADALVGAALESGGRDNITVVVVDVARGQDDDAGAVTAPRNHERSGAGDDTLPRTGRRTEEGPG